MKYYNIIIPKNTYLINSFLSVPLLTGALFLCYNIFGMFVRFHPISRVKLLFGVAFFIFRIKPNRP
ncbi:bacteriophage holin [Lactococcus lactis]|uniref:bacteriophage holin n=1 Tax=Lactococcus lactis TaxID=1358 RepID=UPI0021A6D5E5|nr:bacteriophage holin [Lactococcus lactis]